jgi:hypothetical protein
MSNGAGQFSDKEGVGVGSCEGSFVLAKVCEGSLSAGGGKAPVVSQMPEPLLCFLLVTARCSRLFQHLLTLTVVLTLTLTLALTLTRTLTLARTLTLTRTLIVSSSSVS